MVIDGLARAKAAGVVVGLDSGRRSMEEQSRLYQRYLQGGPRAAPPGQSAHEYGLAVDIYVEDGARKRYEGPKFEVAVAAFQKAGCQFLPPQYDDPGHAQHPQWRQLAALEHGPERLPTSTPRLPVGPIPSAPVAPGPAVPGRRCT